MDPRLQERIGGLAGAEGPVRVIALDDTRALAAEFGLPLRDVQTAALRTRVCPRRYLSSLGTVGWEGQVTLLESAVAVVGLGGLGGSVTEALARMGVGRLVLIDFDRFAEHNLNRQILACEADLDRPKAAAAQARVAAVNSAVQVDVHAEEAVHDNLPRLLAGAQVVVDALDRLPSRLVLQDAAQAQGIPLVHGAIAGMVGQVTTILPGDAGLHALYGRADIPERGAEAERGCPAATPLMVAAWQVQEVIKLLLGIGQPLRHRVLFLDAEAGTASSMPLA